VRVAESTAVPAPQATPALKSENLSRLASPAAVVWTASLAWFAIFLTISIRAYRAFLDHRFDLGNMTQAVWSTAHWHPLEVTELTGRQITRLGAHVDPLVALFVPFWWLWPSPVMLLTAQVLALALGALPVFWLGRKYLASERGAAYLALSYLLYPGLQWRALNEFYPALVAVPFVLFAIWYLDEERFIWFGAFAVLVAASQEQMGLLVGGLGLWYGFRRRRWGVAAAIAGAGVAWTAVAMLVVIPHFSGGPSPFYSRYASVGGSPTGILHTLVTNPISIVRAASTSSDIRFMFWSFVPLLGLFLLAPTLSFIALPQLALSLLSDRSADVSLNGNISAPIVPLLVAGTVLGIARLRQAERMAKLVLLTTGLSLIAGPLPYLGTLAPGQDAHARAAAAAVSLVPSGAAVTATNDLGSHLSARRYIYVFPLISKSQWVVADLRDELVPTIRPGEARDGLAVPREDLVHRPMQFRQAIKRLEHDPLWRLVFSREGIRVWHRQKAIHR
jgi:uncharacterized membrane protein